LAVSGWIVDKSVASRFADPRVIQQLSTVEGTLYICEVGLLEQLYSARSASDYDKMERELRSAFDILPAPARALELAQSLQRDLAHHRGLWHRRPIPDLLIAVTALHHGVGIVHADTDFSLIAQVTALATRRIEVSP
jgi:predicted nucleic acid-binding protein